MKGVTESVGKANSLSQACDKCKYWIMRNEGICDLCSDAFKEESRKGAKWAESQLK